MRRRESCRGFWRRWVMSEIQRAATESNVSEGAAGYDVTTAFSREGDADLPRAWQRTDLASLGEYINGFAFNQAHWADSGLPIVRIAQITGSQGIVDRFPGALPDTYRLSDGDLIFSWSGTLAVVSWQGGPAWLNQHLFKVVPRGGIDRGFLYHLLQASVAEMDKRTHGSTMKHIKRGELREFRLVIPNGSTEQATIARVLDTLDTTIRQTEAIIAKLKQVKQGLLHDLLTRGIDANGELRPPQSQAPHLYKQSSLGWISREWEVRELRDEAEVIDPQPDHRTPKEQSDGAPYIGIGDVSESGDIDLTSCRKVVWKALEKQARSFSIETGDIIYGKIGTIGQPKVLAASLQITLTANVLLIKPRTRTNYIFHTLKSDAFERQVRDITNTTSQPALGIETMRMMALMMPSVDEQTAIADRLDAATKRITLEQKELSKYATMKSGLMDNLLTGRVRVTPLLETVAT